VGVLTARICAGVLLVCATQALGAPPRSTIRIVNLAHPTPTRVLIRLDPSDARYDNAAHPDGFYLETSDSEYATLGAGLGAAANGDTVYAHSGTYVQRITSGAPNAMLNPNIVYHGAYDQSTVQQGTTASNYIFGAPTEARPGCKIRHVMFDGDGPVIVNHVFELSQAVDFTIEECWSRGALRGIIAHGVAYGSFPGANGVLIEDCYFASDYADASPGTDMNAVSMTGITTRQATDVTIRDTVFDFRNATAQRSTFQLSGFINLRMERVLIWCAATTQAAQSYGIRVIGDAAGVNIPNGLHLEDVYLIGQLRAGNPNSGFGLFHLGTVLDSYQSIVDNVSILHSEFTVPSVGQVYFNTKFESDFESGTSGNNNSFSDQIQVHDSVFRGGYVTLSAQESIRHATYTNCKLVGPGRIADYGFPTFGFVFEDSRWITVSNLEIYNVQRGFALSFSGGEPSLPTYNNYKIDILGCRVFDSDYAFWINRSEGETMPMDSLLNGLRSAGNIAVNCGGWAYEYVEPGAAAMTLDQWKALVIPNVPTFWQHGFGDMIFEGNEAALLRSGAVRLPQPLGSSVGPRWNP